MKYIAAIVTLGAGVYTLHWLKSAEIGATLIALAALLTDPKDVLEALGKVVQWRKP